jgi:P-type E1-E2 ATPase
LTILSIIGIQSHLSKDIEESIANLTAADITIRMATGDNKRTAISTARNVGLLDNNWA